MLRSLIFLGLLGLCVIASAAETVAPVPTLPAVDAGAASPELTQRVREEMHQVLLRLATSGALGEHPDQLSLTLDEPPRHAADLGLFVDATGSDRTHDGLRVLGTTPGGTAERVGVRPGDFIVAVNGRSLRDLGTDADGRALAAATLKASVEALPDGTALQLDVLRGSTPLTLSAPLRGVNLPALRVALGSAAVAAAAPAVAAPTASCGRINFSDLAPRQQHLYGATILLVDGVSPGPRGAPTMRLDAGTHELLVAERIPTQVMGMGEIASLRNSKPKSLTVNIAPNTTILVAARLNEGRAIKLNDGSYWDPVMWKAMAETCP